MQFKIPRKGYTETRQIYKKGTIEINNGITVLIGCNGSGKTTLLNEVYEIAREQKIPVYKYDNLNSDDKSTALFNNDFVLLSQLFSSSEGESITIKLTSKVKEIAYLLKHGEKKKSKLELLFDEMDGTKSAPITNKDRILLFDAIDSGLSIDQVHDLKEYFFKGILEAYDNEHLYIIVSANEFELCKDYPCFNVTDGKYVNISSYEEYSKEILKTRAYKDKQIEKLEKEDNANE